MLFFGDEEKRRARFVMNIAYFSIAKVHTINHHDNYTFQGAMKSLSFIWMLQATLDSKFLHRLLTLLSSHG
jgi:hypothetical protein